MSWKKVKISEVSSQIRGVTYKPENISENPTDNHLPILRAGNITETGLLFDDLVYVDRRNISENQILKDGDIVIAASSGSKSIVGKANYFENNWTGSFGAFCKVIRPNKTVYPKYLSYYFQTKDYRNKISKLSEGANINNLRSEDLDNLLLPLPSNSVQQKIASILDKADELRRKDQQLLIKYDELVQSTFYQMFGDPSKNEKELEKGTIREIVSEVKYGTSKPAEENGKYPYLRMNNITYNGDWNFNSLKYINLLEEEKPKYILKKNDLVFNRTNSKELVGKTAVYILDEQMAIAGYLIRVRTNQKANPFYISAYLNSSHGKATLMGMCKNIIGMANINAQEFQDIEILIPDINTQNEFALIVKQIQDQKKVINQQIQKSEALFQSLLQKAFKGELVR